MNTSNDEESVGDGVDRVSKSFIESSGWGNIVDKTTNGDDLTLISSFLPASEDRGNEASLEVSVEHLGEEVDVRYKGTHKNDGHVGGIEESDGVRSIWSCFVICQFQCNLEALEVYDDKEHKCRS